MSDVQKQVYVQILVKKKGCHMTISIKVELMPPLRNLREKANFSLELPNDMEVNIMLTKIGFRKME